MPRQMESRLSLNYQPKERPMVQEIQFTRLTGRNTSFYRLLALYECRWMINKSYLYKDKGCLISASTTLDPSIGFGLNSCHWVPQPIGLA